MADQKLIDEVGRYIDKYYKPENDDIKLDHEILSVFDKISEFRKKRAEKKNLKEDSDQEYDESNRSESAIPRELFETSTTNKQVRKNGLGI